MYPLNIRNHYCSNHIHNSKKNMSLSKYESEIKHLATPTETAYECLSDLRNLEVLKEKMKNTDVPAEAAGEIPTDKLAEVKKYIEDITFDQDSLQLSSPVGQIVLRIVERDPKCIKFASEGSPIPLYVWVQLLPEGETACKMKVTLGAEVNFFMKGMVSKPLQQAADGLANVLGAALQAPATNA